MSRTLALRKEAGEKGRVVLRSPLVGIWSDQPEAGTMVGPGSPAGTLRRLADRVALVVPDGVTGTVETVEVRELQAAIGFGDVLFAVHETVGAGSAKKSDAVRRDGRAVVAPTDGVYYRSPSPGAKGYVAVGDRVVAGQAVGLIEVMKTFSPIVYGGASLPERGKVVALLAQDGEEVRAGQPLVEVE
ncbi:MAG TPA: biotin/lipoyl-containing protein [Candidatus Polarisedimenticolaceae bacterium]|nr:biotin/lipoyl-containing protein [Candidatus Polarisedimenticolaceae bacterium]